ncbi:MAG: TolC family protein [Candidatus Thiodiazotropha sp. (ex Monitilora ramsayi)]|nr:TolC family protein [Candidatus Thiodiazotropha sp. (ex Monitilora ramsayi)]
MFCSVVATLSRVHLYEYRVHLPILLLLFGSNSTAGTTEDLSAFQAMLDQLQRHPSVLMSASGTRQWEVSAEGALGLPNPNITLGLNNVPINEPTSFDRYLPSSRSLEIRQSFPNIKGREAVRSTHLARAALAELERIQILADLKKRLITALAERQSISESKTVLDRKLALLQELDRWLRGEMEGGEAVYSRFDELDVQRGEIEEKQLALEGKDRRWQAELRQLIDRVPDSLKLPQISLRQWTGDPSELVVVRVALGKLEVAQAQVREKQAAFSPDFAFGAAWQQRESGENFDGDDWFTLKFTASVPLWAGSNQTPKLQAAEEAVTAKMAQRDRRLREARGSYESALADYRTADALLNAMQKRNDRLHDLEASNRRRYESGEGNLESVIRPALQRADVALDMARENARRTIAAARINTLLMEESQ